MGKGTPHLFKHLQRLDLSTELLLVPLLPDHHLQLRHCATQARHPALLPTHLSELSLQNGSLHPRIHGPRLGLRRHLLFNFPMLTHLVRLDDVAAWTLHQSARLLSMIVIAKPTR